MAEMFVGLFEVRPLKRCELVEDDVSGAFARCYGMAPDAASAEAKMRRSLKKQRLAVVGTEFCKSSRGTEWENPDSPEAAECMREAEDSGEVVLGSLDTWAEDEG